ncbi:hypothetical protein HZB94_00865 [Candidatus Falkowbacteria bacterium]|nr:hypothetical protein [Candidatus Falkowbacteria bacterium]
MNSYTVIYETREGRICFKPLGNEKKFSDAARHAEKMILQAETTILVLCRDEDTDSLIRHLKGQCSSARPARAEQAQDKIRECPFSPLPSAPLRRIRRG